MKKLVLRTICIFIISTAPVGAINEKNIALHRVPQSAYSKISILANLKRINNEAKDSNIIKSINLIEMELVNDIAYLDFITTK